MASKSEKDNEQLPQIFPAEVWIMILGEVKDVVSYQRICNASLYFRSLLLPHLSQLLFPEVVKTLLNKHVVSIRESLPYRLVCQDWRKEVDQLLQTPTFYPYDDQDKRSLFGQGYNGGIYFEDEEDVQEFEQHFDPTHHVADQVNPFIARAVQIKIEYDNEHGIGLVPPEPFYRRLDGLLRKYGHHLWYLTIDLTIRHVEGLVDFYRRRLPLILQLTPNIQTLVILCLESHADAPDEWEIVTQISFPTLHQLDCLYLSDSPAFVVRELVANNPQIGRVDAGINSELLEIYLELLPNLTQLQITCYDGGLEALGSTKVSDQVETLWLDAFEGIIPWNDIFSTVEAQFSDTLTELCLHLPALSGYTDLEEEIPELELPHLETLTLAINYEEVAPPLDFLLPINTLEYLYVQVWVWKEMENKRPFLEKAGKIEEKSVVKLYQFWGELEKSTIWSLFPNLKILKVGMYQKEKGTKLPDKCHSCTRIQWKKAQNYLQ